MINNGQLRRDRKLTSAGIVGKENTDCSEISPYFSQEVIRECEKLLREFGLEVLQGQEKEKEGGKIKTCDGKRKWIKHT